MASFSLQDLLGAYTPYSMSGTNGLLRQLLEEMYGQSGQASAPMPSRMAALRPNPMSFLSQGLNENLRNNFLSGSTSGGGSPSGGSVGGSSASSSPSGPYLGSADTRR